MVCGIHLICYALQSGILAEDFAPAEPGMESLLRLFQDLETCDTWEERDRCEEQCLRALKGHMKSTALKLKGEGDKKVMGNVILQVFLFHI